MIWISAKSVPGIWLRGIILEELLPAISDLIGGTLFCEMLLHHMGAGT